METDYKRPVWHSLNSHLQDFLADRQNRWLIVSGLRGVGKTTLLTQLYGDSRIKELGGQRFYLSLDDLKFSRDSIYELVETIRDWRRHRHPDAPFFLFLDEVHFEQQWSLACKLMFDQVRQLFLVCTGSSALGLKVGPDSARRATLISVDPLSLPEAAAINCLGGAGQIKQIDDGLSQRLKEGLFFQDSAADSYRLLSECQLGVAAYYHQFEPEGPQADQLIDDYINGYKTLPLPASASGDDNRQYRLNQSRDWALQIIRRLLTDDTVRFLSQDQGPPELQLQAVSLARLPDLAVILADSHGPSLATISKRLGVQARTLKSMMSVLILGGLLIEIPPVGGGRLRNTKKSKYLFAAPALRQALLPASPSRLDSGGYDGRLRGSLLEDTVSMYLRRLFDFRLGSSVGVVEYDSQKGGADFIISADSRQGPESVVLEVGYQKSQANQVANSLKNGGRYGLLVTDGTDLKFDEKNNAVHVPLELFLLV